MISFGFIYELYIIFIYLILFILTILLFLFSIFYKGETGDTGETGKTGLNGSQFVNNTYFDMNFRNLDISVGRSIRLTETSRELISFDSETENGKKLTIVIDPGNILFYVHTMNLPENIIVDLEIKNANLTANIQLKGQKFYKIYRDKNVSIFIYETFNSIQ